MIEFFKTKESFKAAEKMLSIVVNNERGKSTSSLLGYITEVLHREYINVTNEPQEPIGQSQQLAQSTILNDSAHFTLNLQTPTNTTTTAQIIQPSQHSVSNHQQQSIQQVASTNVGATLSTAQIIQGNPITIRPQSSSTGIVMTGQIQHQQQQQANNKPPQVIKLQPFVPTAVQNQAGQCQTVGSTSTLAPNKVIYMSHQSPVKSNANKLIKIGGVVPQVIAAHPAGNVVDIKHSDMVVTDFNGFVQQQQQQQHHHQQQQSQSTQPTACQPQAMITTAGHTVVTQQQSQQHQLQTTQQPQQVLNLVLVTDGINGGVSYLSLVPQN